MNFPLMLAPFPEDSRSNSTRVEAGFEGELGRFLEIKADFPAGRREGKMDFLPISG